MKVFETKRLILRTWQEGDLEPMTKMNQDKRVMSYFPSCQDREATQGFIHRVHQHFQQHGYTLYAVETKESHKFIGFVGLLRVDFQAHFTPATEIGWRLAFAHWGRGYATEAACHVLHQAFRQWQLEEVVSFTVVANTPSRRVMEKIGLKYQEQEDFDHPKLDSKSPLRRHVLYRLKKKEYESIS